MVDLLDKLDQSQGIPKQVFKSVQQQMLERIAELAESIYEQKRSVIIVFEGWDAAGKGTTIRSLIERLDARGYKVLATQAARTYEKQKPWLWRFWMNIPRYGQIAIFDRSWYGRVLVERVHGLTPVPEWIAAYEEINQFERTLADDGTILLKFWLHISRKEQLRRFIDLSQRPETAWQVTAEDWENHRRYDEYVAAVRDMLANTNTAVAPWVPIDATDREFRLYSVYRTLIERLEEALNMERSLWPSPQELEARDSTGTESKAGKSKKKEKQRDKDTEPLQDKVKAKGKEKSKNKQGDQHGDHDQAGALIKGKKAKKEKKDKGKDAQPPAMSLAGESGAESGNGQAPNNGTLEVDHA